ncbi:hypothetical protein AKJ16_DCAP08543 [Drosera capensis]
MDVNPFAVPARLRGQNAQVRDRDQSQNVGMKIEIPEFEGRAQPDKFIDWLHMVERVFDLKDLTEEQKEAFLEYYAARQGEKSMEDLISEFDRLRMRCDVDEEEEQTIAQFLGGLKLDIADVVHLQQYWTYDDVCRLSTFSSTGHRA